MSTKRQILFIKHMVCPHCKLVVKQCLEQLGCTVHAAELGHVEIEMPKIPVRQQIEERLKEYGFELLSSREARTVEQVKILLIRLLYYNKSMKWTESISDYLELFLITRYEELDTLFASEYRCSIQEYFNTLRFERAKELISYNELSLQSIARRLGYYSSEELSLEFRRRLNLDIRDYIKAEYNYRVPLDRLI